MTQDAAAKTSSLLEALWQRNLPVLRSRLDLLDQAATAANSGLLGNDFRREAGATAHKLAGSLGMFGYAEGTEIARSLENILEGSEPFSAAMLSDLTVRLRASLKLVQDQSY